MWFDMPHKVIIYQARSQEFGCVCMCVCVGGGGG